MAVEWDIPVVSKGGGVVAGAEIAVSMLVELAVVDPDPRHLVHPHQAPLEAVVGLVVARVRHAAALHLLPAHLEVVVPELVAAGKLLQRSLEHKVQHILRSIGFVL